MNQKERLLKKVLWGMVLALVVSAVGAFVSPSIADGVKSVLIIVFWGLFIILLFFRHLMTGLFGYSIVYFYAFVLGVIIEPMLEKYLGTIGYGGIIGVFLATSLLFILLGTFGYKTNRNFSNWGIFLLFALIVLILAMVASMFFPAISGLSLVFSGIGLLIFAGFTIYDFNQMKQNDFTDDEVPILILNLFLNFFNMFQDLLHLVGEGLVSFFD